MTYEEFAKDYRDSIPAQPGVYRYYDAEGVILYIGKAKDLKKRVSSYFTKNDHSFRIAYMVRRITRIECTLVDTEQDAFLLENNLIKKYQPRYNVLLRDDKSYPYIVIKKEDYPRVYLTRQLIKDGSEYLGPYTSVSQVRIILNLLTTIFPLRTCSLHLSPKNIEAGKFKVCLQYHIRNCLGPCENLQGKEDYDESIRQIRNILKSNFGSVLFYLKGRMQAYAEAMEFERAEEFKQKMELLTDYQSKSTIVNPKLNNLDVYGYTETETHAFINYLRIANGSVIQAKAVELKRVLDESREELLETAVAEFSFGDNISIDEILLPFEIGTQFEAVKVSVPQIGDKKKLVDLATRNAFYARQERVRQLQTSEEKNPSFRIMKALKEDLRLKELPRHIECFDNSNLQGTNPVSSIVVFKDARPSKKDYRFFNVKTVEGPDDFASMEEAVFRRYRRLLDESQPLPNLIVIDGGKGQLSSAVDSLKKLGIYGQVSIVGIAKRLEEIYYPEDSLPLYINKKSESLRLIQRIRDEAHRFGITAHRNKRSKGQTGSELSGIKGVGKKTFEKLMLHFKSVKKLKEADAAQLVAVVGEAKAKLLLDYFAGKTTGGAE